MRALLAGIVCVALVGCSPVGSTSAPEGEKKTKSKSEPVLTIKYQGRNAAQWAERLYDADVFISQEAASLSGHYQDEAIPFILKGMSHKIEHVRRNSFQAWRQQYDDEYHDTLVDLCRKNLYADSGKVNIWAAYFAGHHKLKEMLPEIQQASKVDNANKIDYERIIAMLK